MPRQTMLSIDVGTSSVKVALVADDGQIAATAVRPIATTELPGGGAEQDPAQIWHAVLDAGREVTRAAAELGEVAGITCTSQYFSIVPVDPNGREVGNLILWLDSRGHPYSQQILGRAEGVLEQFLATNGLFPLPTGNDSLSHALFLQHERPEIYRRAACFLEPMDFITARLSGRCTASACSAFSQILTDNRDPDHVCYDDNLLRMSGLDRDKLPPLIESGSIVGGLMPEAAEQLGIATGTPVFAGINDTQAAAVGTGTFIHARGGINVGTTCQVLAFVDSLRADLTSNVFSMPSPHPGRYVVMAENGLGGRLLQHFLENLVFADDALARHSTNDAFAGVEEALASSPAGANKLLYLPWLTGSQTPTAIPSMRGGFLNMSLATNRADMLRAVIEGITLSLRWQLPATEALCGESFAELGFAGGGAQSRQWAQTVANIMDRPVVQMAEPRHVTNRATAFLAFERLGTVDRDQHPTFCPIAARFEPRAETRATYDLLFDQFGEIFERTGPIFRALNPETIDYEALDSTTTSEE